jgi:DNA-binding CsgD family transcriptional regulator
VGTGVELPSNGLGTAVEIGRIASTPGSVEQRVAALWEPLRRVVPFQAACIKLVDAAREESRLISVGYDEKFREYLVSPENMAEVELIGYRRTRHAMRLQDFPVPVERIRSWVEYLGPAGYRGGLGVGLFTMDGRYLGVLGLNTDHPDHPTEAARDLIGMLAPVIANAVDPLRTMTEAARLVCDATAGVVLTHGGDTLPLASLPAHPVLAAGSAALVAAQWLAIEGASGAFVCPWPEATPDGELLRLTVLARRPEFPVRWAGVALVSPLGDRRGVTRRELQILGLLIEGWSNLRIATTLVIAERTVATHVEHILVKLDAPSRTLAAARALRLGLYVPRSVTFPGST